MSVKDNKVPCRELPSRRAADCGRNGLAAEYLLCMDDGEWAGYIVDDAEGDVVAFLWMWNSMISNLFAGDG